jgi:acetyl esterase
MALDAASVGFMKQVAETPGAKPIEQMSPGEARALGEGFAKAAGAGPKMARVDDLRVEAKTGTFPIRVLVPEGGVRGVLVWYHGGGWVIGSVAESDTLTRKLAARTHCAVVNVDYRMAPEHRFPVAADDAYAALEWAASNATKLAGRSVPLLVGGDSAGGNLAAVVAQRARDRKGPAIALQLLVYPVTDSDVSRASYNAKENQLLLTRGSMEWFFDHYTPSAADRTHPDVAPLRAKDLSKLPPAVVLTAEHDVLRDEGEEYAAKLAKAGVPVVHKRFSGQLHGFFTMVNILPGHEAGLDFAVEQIAARLDAHQEAR